MRVNLCIWLYFLCVCLRVYTRRRTTDHGCISHESHVWLFQGLSCMKRCIIGHRCTSHEGIRACMHAHIDSPIYLLRRNDKRKKESRPEKWKTIFGFSLSNYILCTHVIELRKCKPFLQPCIVAHVYLSHTGRVCTDVICKKHDCLEVHSTVAGDLQ